MLLRLSLCLRIEHKNKEIALATQEL